MNGPMFLYKTAAIRSAIKAIMEPSSGRRVAIVAYVGADALSFIPKPSGVEIYCSDNPVGTNPKGIAALRSEGADVYFVSGLHMKVYWSEKAGAAVGSANLSENALGDGGIAEAMYLLRDSAGINVERVLAALRRDHKMRKVTNSVLEEFSRRYNNAQTTVERTCANDEAPDFAKYAAMRHRVPFKVAIWEYRAKPGFSEKQRRAAGDAANVGLADSIEWIADCIEDQDEIFLPGDWALALKVKDESRVVGASWILCSVVLREYRKQTILEVKGRRRSGPPFTFETKRFRNAWTAAGEKGLVSFNESIIPGDKLISALAKTYET